MTPFRQRFLSSCSSQGRASTKKKDGRKLIDTVEGGGKKKGGGEEEEGRSIRYQSKKASSIPLPFPFPSSAPADVSSSFERQTADTGGFHQRLKI